MDKKIKSLVIRFIEDTVITRWTLNDVAYSVSPQRRNTIKKEELINGIVLIVFEAEV